MLKGKNSIEPSDLNIKDIAVAHTVYDFDSIFKNKDNVKIKKLKKF